MKQTNNPKALGEVMDVAILDELLPAIAPLAPTQPRRADRWDRLLKRIHAETAAEATDPAAAISDLTTVRADAGGWIELTPLVAIKLLRSDGKTQSLLMRLQPGGKLPAHDHLLDEECIVLEGDAYLGDCVVHAGDYHLAPRGSHHGEIGSKTGALLFLRGACVPAKRL